MKHTEVNCPVKGCSQEHSKGGYCEPLALEIMSRQVHKNWNALAETKPYSGALGIEFLLQSLWQWPLDSIPVDLIERPKGESAAIFAELPLSAIAWASLLIAESKGLLLSKTEHPYKWADRMLELTGKHYCDVRCDDKGKHWGNYCPQRTSAEPLHDFVANAEAKIKPKKVSGGPGLDLDN